MKSKGGRLCFGGEVDCREVRKKEEPRGVEDRKKKRKSKEGFGLIETVCFSLVCALYPLLSQVDYCR